MERAELPNLVFFVARARPVTIATMKAVSNKTAPLGLRMRVIAIVSN
jgi:hypothetical protein